MGFINEVSPKRFEENIKFVFKLAFKKLKSTLLRKNRISFYSKKFDSQFYNHYFHKAASRLGIRIEEFHDPLNSKSGSKTLNNDYLKLVFTSEEFKRDFMDYLTGGLVEDYQNNLRRKVRQLLVKFDHLFDSLNPSVIENGITTIQKYFRTNKQCKLPWMKNEVVTAVQTFGFMINNF